MEALQVKPTTTVAELFAHAGLAGGALMCSTTFEVMEMAPWRVFIALGLNENADAMKASLAPMIEA